MSVIDPTSGAIAGVATEAEAPKPRTLADVKAEIEAAAKRAAELVAKRTDLDAADAALATLKANLKAEWEAEKAKLEALF